MFRLAELVLKAYADTIAESIVIRSYDKNGNSRDYRRDTTDPEKKIISSIIYGGLLAIRSGADKQSVKDACEYIGQLQIPEMSGRDTIYDPIDNYPERPTRAERKSDMKKYKLIETNHGDSKILTTGTLSEILNYLQDNPRIYEWVQDEITGDPAMTDEQKAEEIAGLQIDLTDIDSAEDLQQELDKVDLSWWSLTVTEQGAGLGRFEGENSYFIGDYKIVNEIADSELWVYKFDEDAEDYEHHDTIEMPDWWEDYLFTATTNSPAIEKRFEDYIRQELGI